MLIELSEWSLIFSLSHCGNSLIIKKMRMGGETKFLGLIYLALQAKSAVFYVNFTVKDLWSDLF